MNLQEQIDFIMGPQAPMDDSYFSRVQVSRGQLLGDSCPAIPPTDPAALNEYVLHLQYYDLPMCLYIDYRRTGHVAFHSDAMNAADSWWQHPSWIDSGRIRLWETQGSATPAPRHAGIGGLILRALDGRPEFWDWIIGYTRWNFDIWLKSRINNSALYIGVREGAFMLQYATWIVATLPDSYPNAAAIRAQFLADAEAVAVNYFGRLQLSDGSWRWNDGDVKDEDGGTLVGITQPFQIGLLLCALIDLHRLTTNPSVKDSLKTQILNGCRHLYSDGPYRKDEPIPYDPSKRRRSFWYLYHGGTSVNPTKFERGGWSYPGNNSTEIQDERQAIGPVVAAYGYAYMLSGDPFFKTAGDELWDSAYGSTDGIHNFFDTDGKGYNQNARRAGSYLVWAGAPALPLPIPTPAPAPVPEPVPSPIPEPIPEPVPEPAPPVIQPVPQPPTDSVPVVTITSPANGATLSGQATVTATVTGSEIDSVYLIVDGESMGTSGAPYSFSIDTKKLSNGPHSMFVRVWNKAGRAGDSATLSVTVNNVEVVPEPVPTPVPEPTPTPVPEPLPTPAPEPPPPSPCSISAPESISVPRNGSGTIAVTLQNLSGPVDVKVITPDDQVTVSPMLWHAGPTSTVKQFRVRVRKRTRKIQIQSPCGTREVLVIVT